MRFSHDHAVIGAAVLEKWNFARPLIESTLHHGDLALSEADDPVAFRLTATVNLAGKICRRLGIGQRAPEPDLDLAHTPAARALGVSVERLEKLVAEFKTLFKDNRDFFLG